MLTAEDRRLGGWGHPVAGREAGTAPAEEDKRRRGAWRRRKGRAQRRGAPEKGKAACDPAPRPQPWISVHTELDLGSRQVRGAG